MTKKAIVLLSGGLDSATCLVIAQASGFACTALSFAYGQRHYAELAAARDLARVYGVSHQLFELPIQQFGGSALTDVKMSVLDYAGGDSVPNTYVPARNTIFLAVAMGFAEVLDASAIFIGVSSIDYSGYVDCRPEYINAMQRVADLATAKAVAGQHVLITTPLLGLSKAETIARGSALGLDYSLTVSCYQATETGLACGRCDSCYLRKKGFYDAGLADPTRYR